MKIFLLLSIFILSTIHFSALPAQSSISFGSYYTPKTSALNFVTYGRQQGFEHRLGFNAQFAVNYHYDERVTFTTGILFSLDRFNTLDYTVTPPCSITPTGVNNFNSWWKHETELHYLGIPLEARYYARNTGNRIYFKMGYAFLFQVREARTTSLISCGVSDLPIRGLADEARDFSTKYLFGVGLEIPNGAASVITIEPELAYTARLPYVNQTLLRTLNTYFRVMDIGLRMGMRF